MLSSEQGVYVAESVTAKNTKQAKGRFRTYEDQNDMVLLMDLLGYFSLFHFLLFLIIYMYFLQDNISSNHSVRREPASREAASGKKDFGKSTKKAGMLFLHSIF